MKKLLLLSLLFSLMISAQNQRFTYEYRFVPDSTNRAEVMIESMILEVTPKFSKFYSETVFKSDSLLNALYEKEIAATGSMNVRQDLQKGLVRYTVIKELPEFKTYLVTRIGQSKLKILDERMLTWKILPETEKIGEFKAQKATTTFAGRNWTAWFTTEIPLQEGPYKFHGLPGFIVKMSDDTKSHSFDLKAIRNLSSADLANVDPAKNFGFDFGDDLSMDRKKYTEFYQESRRDPNKSIRLAVAEMAMIQIDGKMMEIAEFLRNREKVQKEKIAKDNNVIELDLLK